MTDEKKVVSLTDARDKEKTEEEKLPQEAVYCSFCGRPNQVVIKMVKGPGVNICSECVMICVQYFIMENKLPSSEVKKVLDSFWKGIKK